MVYPYFESWVSCFCVCLSLGTGVSSYKEVKMKIPPKIYEKGRQSYEHLFKAKGMLTTYQPKNE